MNMKIKCCCDDEPFDCMAVDCVAIVGFTNVFGVGGTFGDTRISTVSPCSSSSYFDDGLGPYMDGTFPDHIVTGDGCRWEFGVIGDPPPVGSLWYSISNTVGDERKWLMKGIVEFTAGEWRLSVRFQGAVSTNNGTAFWVRTATADEGPYGAYAFSAALSTAGAFDDPGCLLNVPTLTIGPC